VVRQERPAFSPVLQMSKQAKAYRREDLGCPRSANRVRPSGPSPDRRSARVFKGDVASYLSVERKRLGFAGRDAPSSEGSYFIQRCNADAAGRDFLARTEWGGSK